MSRAFSAAQENKAREFTAENEKFRVVLGEYGNFVEDRQEDGEIEEIPVFDVSLFLCGQLPTA